MATPACLLGHQDAVGHDTRGLLRLVRAADNIIIMAQGRVSAQGEPLALKAQFGEGYSLSLALKSHSDRYA